MGLQKDIELKSGFVVGFHDIEQIKLDIKNKSCAVKISSYKNKASKAEDKAPLFSNWYQIPFEDVDSFVKKIHAAMKSHPDFVGSTEPV